MEVTELSKKKSHTENYNTKTDSREGFFKKHRNEDHEKLKVCAFHKIINQLKQNFDSIHEGNKNIADEDDYGKPSKNAPSYLI